MFGHWITLDREVSNLAGMRVTTVTIDDLGRWAYARYRRLQVCNGTFRSAQRMRKDGCPLSLALAVLPGRN